MEPTQSSKPRTVSVCIEDLLRMPAQMRPDRVLIFFAAFSLEQPACTMVPNAPSQLIHPDFESTPEVLDSDMLIYFEYIVKKEPGDFSQKPIKPPVMGRHRDLVFHRDGNGKIVLDRLDQVFRRYVS